MKLFQNNDGANAQAKAVLAFLSSRDGIDGSWSKDFHRCMAEPTVARWHNCREQGYVVSMRSADYKRQINIAWYEHRNSDSICAIVWEQTTINPPTIDTMPKGTFKDSGDYAHSVSYGKVAEMATWVYDRLTGFWEQTSTVKKTVEDDDAIDDVNKYFPTI